MAPPDKQEAKGFHAKLAKKFHRDERMGRRFGEFSQSSQRRKEELV